MKIDKLDINKRKIFLCCLILGVVLLVTLIVKATWAKYEKSQVIEIATGTVNYKYNPADLQMIAMKKQNANPTCTTDNTTCYGTITKMPDSGYAINTTNSYCTIPNSTTKDTGVTLKTNTSGEHVMKGIQTGAKCYLFFDKLSLKDIIILQGATPASSTPTKDCTSSSCSGLFSQANVNQNGTTGTYYYYRGLVSNNWVKFGGHFWRIIGVNTDGTVRLIYTGTGSGASAATASNVTISSDGVKGTGTGTQITYDSKNTHAYNADNGQANDVGWTYSGELQRPSDTNNNGETGTPSNVYTIAKGWLDANITDQTKIADGKFCNDRTTTSGSTWAINGPTFYYAAYNRRNSDSTPSLKCGTSAGDIYTTKVGLITLDEVRYAGGSSSYNGAYYLNTSQKYWTMSPSDWYAPSDCPQVFYVEYGSLTNGYGVYGTFGVRPVINLTTSATVSGGDGTYTTPYEVS